MNMLFPPCRSLLSLLDYMGDKKVCEIGIRWGDSSKVFLEADVFLYMIDPWEGYEGYDTPHNYEKDYQTTLENIKGFEGRYQIIKKKSDDAVNDVPNDLDLIYIDGNHYFEYVKKDIENYWPKVKKGGWLTGDDITMAGVADAVNEFIGNNPELKLEIMGRNWAIHKI